MQSITEQLPAEDLDKQLRDRQRLVERLINIVGMTAVSMVVVAVIWGVIYKIIIAKGEVLAGSIFLAFIVGLILFASLSIYRASLVKASSKRQYDKIDGPPPELHTAKLLPDSAPSVTENTTDLLEVVEKDMKGNA